MRKIIANAQPQQLFSFRQNIRRRFQEEFKRISQKYELSSMVLVLDLVSARIISTLFSITELVDSKIVFIERLQVVRKPLEHHAIYFVSPSEKSVEAMMKDYESQTTCKYRKAHVLFTSAIDRTLMKKIANSPFFLKRLARHSFKEFYCELEILSGNCAHLGLSYLSLALSEDSNQEKQMRVNIGKRFVDLVAGYEPLKTVRFYYEVSANRVSQRIAERAAKEVKTYLDNLLDSKSSAITPDAPDLTFFITDRSVDIITPLIHGYAYESLLYDLLQIGKEGKKGIDMTKLNGQIFEEFRYRHISHALTVLPERVDTLSDKINNPAKLQALQIKKLKEDKQMLEAHLEIMHELWQKFQQKKLTEIGELQLSLATGITDDGKQTSSSEIFILVVNLIKENTTLSKEELLRLALLTLSCIKLSKEDYQTLINLFKEEDKNILRNLTVFGITYDRKISKSTKSIDKSEMERARNKLKEKSMPSERFTCALQIVLPSLIDFLKIERNQSQKKFMEELVVSVDLQPGLSAKFNEKRLVCFMCGGLSQTQICSLKRIPSLSSVLLAADCIITPSNFVQSLGKIDILNKQPIST